MRKEIPLSRKIGYSIMCQGAVLPFMELIFLLFCDRSYFDLAFIGFTGFGAYVQQGSLRSAQITLPAVLVAGTYPLFLIYIMNIQSAYNGPYNYLNPAHSVFSLIFTLLFSAWCFIHSAFLIQVILRGRQSTE